MNETNERWAPGTTLTVEIADVAYGGAGVGRVGGKVVMAYGLLPGEVAEVNVTRDYGRYAQANAVRLVSPAAPRRVEPGCPLALRCGAEGAAACPGCRYQHADYAEELALKAGQLRSLLTRQGGQRDVELPPPVASPAPSGYRNKIVLHTGLRAVPPSSEMPLLGYYAEDNATLVDVARCPLAVDPINELLARVRASPDALAGVRHGGSVTFRHTARDGAVWWHGAASGPARRGVLSPAADDVAPGPADLTEDSPVGPLAVPRESFFQVHPPVADLLVREVAARLTAEPPDALVDLFCGVGVFALAGAKAGARTVYGIDSDARAVEAAGRNAASLGVGNVRWLRAAADPGLRRVRSALGARPVVIVDPPRAGLGRGLVRALAALRPARVFYVSCAADTLARDAAWFLEDGYRVASAALFDMFPRTAHFETLVDLRPSECAV